MGGLPKESRDANVSEQGSELSGSWRYVIILLILYIVSQLDRNILALLLDSIKNEFQLSDSQIGLLAGPAFAIFYAVGALPLGWAMDRFSRRKVIFAGVMCWSLATVACGMFRSFGGLFAARSMVGAGEAVLMPGSQSIIADVFPRDRMAMPFSVYSLGAKLGAGISFLIGGALTTVINPSQSYLLPLIGDVVGWQMVFILAGLPGIIISFLIFLFPEPARRRVEVKGSGPESSYGYLDYWKFILRNKRFIFGHHMGVVLLMMMATGVQTWSPAFFSRVHGWPLDQTGLWLGITIMVGPLVGLPIYGALADWMMRKGRHDAYLLLLIVGCLGAIPPYIMAYTVASPWLCLIGIALGLMISCAYLSLLPAALQAIVPGNARGKAASVSLLIGAFGGMSMGPLIIGWFTDYVFRDANMVGRSLVACILLFMPLSAALFAFALKPFAAALRTENGLSGPSTALARVAL